MPLYDRPYMRAGPQYNRRNPLFWLLGLIVGVFFLEAILGVFVGRNEVARFITQYVALTKWSVYSGYGWTFLTYVFVHQGAFHLLGNCLILFLMGMPVLQGIGERRFTFLCVVTALGGALLYLAFHIGGQTGWGVTGASAIGLGILTVFCLMRMDEPITFLLFFVLPVTIKPRYLLMVVALIELVFLVGELQGTSAVASSAHLGGMLTGFLFHRHVIRGGSFFDRRTVKFHSPRTPERRRQRSTPQQPRYRVNIGNRSDLRGEVDRILDKINSQGFGSLTPEEKRLLDKARDILSK